jgi:hypothetical protein
MGNSVTPSIIAPPPLPNGAESPTAPVENAAVIAPPEAEQPTSALGNEPQWNELEQQLMGVFESRQTNSQGAQGNADADTSTGDADEAVNSPAVQPTSPVETSEIAPQQAGTATPVDAAPVPEPPTDLAAQEVPEPGSPQSSYDPFALPVPGPQTPPATDGQPGPVTQSPQQPPPGYVEFMGNVMPIQEAQVMRQTYEWALSLTPEESNAVNQTLQQRRAQSPQPVQQPYNGPGTQQAPQYQPSQPAGLTGQPLPPPQLDPNTVEDPNLAAYLNAQSQYMAQQQQLLLAQQQQLAELSNGFGDIYQNTVQQQHAQSAAELERARSDFADRYALTPGELVQVESRLAASGIMPSLVDRRGGPSGDVYQAIMDGFETTAWTSPDLRQRLIASQTQPAIDEANDTRQRAAKLGSLSGSGGSVPRTESAPMNSEDRRKAMVAEITAAMNQNPS